MYPSALAFRQQLHRLKARLSFALKAKGEQAFETEQGLKILLRSSDPLLQSQRELWYPEAIPLSLSRAELKSWPADIILDCSFDHSVRDLPSGLISEGKRSHSPLCTQPYVEMDIPLLPDFEQFLMDVMPKKRRAYIRKALQLNYRSELSREPEDLESFLQTILHPATQQRHGDRSQLLSSSDILAKGDKWQLQIIRDSSGEIIGGNLLLRSPSQQQLRVWRQAVHPRFDHDKEKQQLLLLLNSLPLQLGCSEGYRTVSFGISPHRPEDSNFYSKRLWSCRPAWNPTQAWVTVAAKTEAGLASLEQFSFLCARPTAQTPDSVLLPRALMAAGRRQELLTWFDRYAHEDLSFVATLHKGILRFVSIAELTQWNSEAPASSHPLQLP